MAPHAMRHAGAACLSAAALLAGCAQAPVAAPVADHGLFFDDFSYAAPAAMRAQGWQLRDGTGHPGLPGGRFDARAISLVDDPAHPGNRLVRLSATTDGTGAGTVQAQLCHQRRYLDGTYAARIRFSDAPSEGARGDFVVESFYAVSPLKHAFDPDFSEVDWEYLPEGGWGSPRTRLYAVSWQTVQLDPWEAHNAAHEESGAFGGWHTLVMQVGGGHVRDFVDGREVAVHGGRDVPVAPMTISFNLWFATGGPLPAGGAPRTWDEDVDWVFHARDAILAPAQVEARVAALRAAHTAHVDSLPPADPREPPRCDL